MSQKELSLESSKVEPGKMSNKEPVSTIPESGE